MSRVLAFFKGPAEEEPPASVLAAWNNYASGCVSRLTAVSRIAHKPRTRKTSLGR
jgi:hypothetical protein